MIKPNGGYMLFTIKKSYIVWQKNYVSVLFDEELKVKRNMNANYEYYDHIVIILPSKTLN